MRACGRCGGVATKPSRLDEYRYELMGIPVILVNAAWQFVCDDCAHEVTLIPDQEGLTAAVAVARVHVPIKLNGKEIRFLRKALGFTAATLGDGIGTSAETISRWVRDHAPISPKSEIILRVLVAASLSDNAPAIDVNLPAIISMTIKPIRNGFDSAPMRFERVKLKENRKKRE